MPTDEGFPTVAERIAAQARLEEPAQTAETAGFWSSAITNHVSDGVQAVIRRYAEESYGVSNPRIEMAMTGSPYQETIVDRDSAYEPKILTWCLQSQASPYANLVLPSVFIGVYEPSLIMWGGEKNAETHPPDAEVVLLGAAIHKACNVHVQVYRLIKTGKARYFIQADSFGEPPILHRKEHSWRQLLRLTG